MFYSGISYLCRSQWPRGPRPLAYCDRGFESHTGMDVCLLYVDYSSRGALPTVARRVWSRNLVNYETIGTLGCRARENKQTNNLLSVYVAIIYICKPIGIPWRTLTFNLLILYLCKSNLFWWWPNDGSKHVAFCSSVKYIRLFCFVRRSFSYPFVERDCLYGWS
jgi:hypothetical protein